MKRNLTAAAALLAALLLLLTACGGGGSASVSGGGDGGDAWSESAAGDAGGWTGEDSADMDQSAPSAPEAGGGQTIPANAKVIYTADMELEAQSFDTACQALEHIVAGVGGWFESRTLNQGGRYRSLFCTVRVPAEHFTDFLDQAGQAAHVTYRQDGQEDVSEMYYDTEARLTTQRTKLERLQALLAQAESMEDIITLESAISDTELEIEYLTGSLRHYDSLIGYSTVTLRLSEVYRLSDDDEAPVTFGQRMRTAFSNGLRRCGQNLEDFAVFLAGNWLWLLILAALAGGFAFLVLRRIRARRARRAAPPAEPPERGDK